MTPMPGYTHLQRAVPSSVGLWLGAFAEAMLDDRDIARATRPAVDSCPLGTGAGFGVNVPLDREGVSAELGFARVQLNAAHVQNSRGKLELAVLHALGQALLTVRRFAWDLSLFTTSEYGFVALPAAFTTGSSLMPQKRNPDVVELLRAAYARTAGASTELAAALSLPSGYQRDLQATKGPFLRAVEHGLGALAILPALIEGMTFDTARMRAAISPEMYATDKALELALTGVPFREAYKDVGRTLDVGQERTPEASLAARVSLGGCGALGLDRLRARIDGSANEATAKT
jgi:argininosuccinate lyase